MKWNRGCNGLHQLGQPVAPSILFPVFNPPYPHSTSCEDSRYVKVIKVCRILNIKEKPVYMPVHIR